MDIRRERKLEATFHEVEALSALLLQLSKDLRELQERIQKLEEAKPYGNRQRSASRSD